MGKNKYKIKPQKPKVKYEIKPCRIPYESILPNFSFKDYIIGTEYYTIEHSNQDKNCLLNFLNSSREFCNKTWGEIKRTDQFHAHSLDDNNKDISELKKLNDEIPYFQFKLPNHDKGRFIGYFDEKAIFNIVLYDRDHNIYKRK